MVGKTAGAAAPSPLGGAPSIPGGIKPPGGLAPPVPGGNRVRSNSDQGQGSRMNSAPQLGGLFAGGIPKLRKRGGIDTGG